MNPTECPICSRPMTPDFSTDARWVHAFSPSGVMPFTGRGWGAPIEVCDDCFALATS